MIDGTSIAVSINESRGGGRAGGRKEEEEEERYVERGPRDQSKRPRLRWFCRSVPGSQP